MAYTNPEALEKCFDTLWPILAEKQKGNQEELSFQSGVIWKEEGYKYEIIEKGKNLIENFPKEQPEGFGDLALKLLWISTDDCPVQNLVDYHDNIFFQDQLDSAHKTEIEKALYLLYAENKDEEAFRLLKNALGNKYALISYFFFLKNSERYQVVRPNNMAERLPLIGAKKQCVLQCSWENYQVYLAVLEEVRTFLNNRLTEDVTLTDAQSFVWMFHMLKNTPKCQ